MAECSAHIRLGESLRCRAPEPPAGDGARPRRSSALRRTEGRFRSARRGAATGRGPVRGLDRIHRHHRAAQRSARPNPRAPRCARSDRAGHAGRRRPGAAAGAPPRASTGSPAVGKGLPGRAPQRRRQQQFGRGVAGRVRRLREQRTRSGHQAGHELQQPDPGVRQQGQRDGSRAGARRLVDPRSAQRPTARSSWALSIDERPLTFLRRASW